MYSRKILTVLGSAAAILMTSAFTFQTRAPFVGSEGGTTTLALHNSPVLQKVDGSLDTLNKKLHGRMPASQKVQMLRTALESIKEARKSAPVLSVDKEVYMDYSVESLEHVAWDNEFSIKKCPQYKARIVNDFEPYAEFKPSNPALKRSYEIIEGICS